MIRGIAPIVTSASRNSRAGYDVTGSRSGRAAAIASAVFRSLRQGFAVCEGRTRTRVPAVVVRVIGTQAFETPVHPKVLFGHFEDLRLQQRIEAIHVVRCAVAGIVLKFGSDMDSITGVARQSLGKISQHRSAGYPRKTRGRGTGRGRYRKEVGHHGPLVAITLIRGIPHGLVAPEGANHGPYVVVRDRTAMSGESLA